MPRRKSKTLTEVELEFMQVVWEKGEVTTTDVQEALRRQGRNLSDGSVRKVLSILINKGHLTRRPQGRGFVYKATVPQGQANRKMVQDLVKRAFQGSSALMVASLFEGRPLTAPHRLRHEDKLRIGSLDPGVMVTMSYVSPAEAAIAGESLAVAFGETNVITIGRDPENDVVLSAPTVSAFHAQVERVGQRYRVRDLRSSNGTFVNDKRIQGDVWLKPDDVLRVGPHRFVMGQDQLAQFDTSRTFSKIGEIH